jgi:hypothetical protein
MASKIGEIVANEASDAGTFHPSRLEAGIFATEDSKNLPTNTNKKERRKKKCVFLCVFCGYRRTHALIPFSKAINFYANVGALNVNNRETRENC